MKSIRLNIRAHSFDGKTPIPGSARFVTNPNTASHDLHGQAGSPIDRLGVLRLSDLVAQKLITATEHAYAAWVGHSGQAGVTSFAARRSHLAQGRRVSTSPAQTSDPSAGAGPVGPFALRPNDELVLTSNGQGEQIVALALLIGTAAEVDALINR